MEFSVKPDLTASSYQWYFDTDRIVDEEEQCDGSTTDHLIIHKCQIEQSGDYHCTVTDESGRRYSSKTATLSIGKCEVFVDIFCILKFHINLFWPVLLWDTLYSHFCVLETYCIR